MRGLADKIKRTKVFRYLRDQNTSIACLQEMHSTKRKQHFWNSEWGNKIYYSHGESNARGVAILIQRDLDIKKVNVQKDIKGRLITITFELHETKYRIINVYAPNEPNVNNPVFFVSLINSLQNASEDHVFMIGDFSQTFDRKLDKKGGKTFEKSTLSAEIINQFLEEAEWCDVWRLLHENKFTFTWKRSKPLIMCRLDYILAPLGTLSIIDSCEIQPAI